MKITRTFAVAAGFAAGNKSMRSGGRVVWNEDDYNEASRVTEKLLALACTAVLSTRSVQ